MIGDELRQVRHERGLSLRSAAPMIPITWQGLSRLERGDVNASVQMLENVARAYAIEIVISAAGVQVRDGQAV